MTSANEHIAPFFEARLSSIDVIKPLLLKSRKRSAGSQFAIAGLDDGGDGEGPVKRCLRRRTRSYLSYRMPRRLKLAKALKGSAAEAEAEESSVSNTAPVVRVKVLNRRCQRYIKRMRLDSFTVTRGWLPTHLWHAKRMHMQRVWGLMVPVRHSFRGASAVSNLLRYDATVQDVSFLSMLRLTDLALDTIRAIFSELMDPTILSIMFETEDIISGSREYEVAVYNRGTYPNSCLGPVRIHFLPSNDSDSTTRDVTIWAHPSFAALLMKLMKEILASNADIEGSPENHISESRNLCRFSIRGKRARAIIRDAFWPAHLGNNVQGANSNNDRTFADLLNSEGLNAVWKDGYALSATCIDPRAVDWGKRGQGIPARLALNPMFRWRGLSHEQWEQKCFGEVRAPKRIIWPSNGQSSRSTIWNCDGVDDSTSFDHVSDKMINAARTDLIVNKEPLYQSESETGVFRSYLESSRQTSLNEEGFKFVSSRNSNLYRHFPAVFVRRSSHYATKSVSPDALFSVPETKWTSTDDDVSGWDVILPSSWVRTVWCSLQFAGAAAIGLEEAEAIDTLSGQLSFPRDYPDTAAGLEYRDRKKRELSELLAKRPRRIAHLAAKLEQSCAPDWMQLFDDDTSLPVWIRTNQYLQPFLPPQQSASKRKPFWQSIKKGSSENDSRQDIVQMDAFPHALPFNTIVSVSIVAASRGVPASGARLFQPSAEDIACFEYYFQQKRSVDLSGVRRLGEWRGIEEEVPLCAAKDTPRMLIGFVSSGLLCPRGNCGVGVGGCNALRLYETFRSNLLHVQYDVRDARRLVLFQNPGSRWLRPAILNVVPMGR